jgi:uncharacterized protein YceK
MPEVRIWQKLGFGMATMHLTITLALSGSPTVSAKTKTGTRYDKAYTKAEWYASHLQPWKETASCEYEAS